MDIPRFHTPPTEVSNDAQERMNMVQDQQAYNLDGSFPGYSQHYRDYPDGWNGTDGINAQPGQSYEARSAQVPAFEASFYQPRSYDAQPGQSYEAQYVQPAQLQLSNQRPPAEASYQPQLDTTHSSGESWRDLSLQQRKQLPREERLSADTDKKGRKDGSSRKNGEDLRTYFNEHHSDLGIHIPTKQRIDGKATEYRSTGNILREVNRQAQELGIDLTYLTEDPEKAHQKSREYVKDPVHYESDGQ